MARKKQPGYFVFSKDWLGSRRLKTIAKDTKGVYADILAELAIEPHRGALRLRDYDLRPKNKRSRTYRCLEKPTVDGRLPYFADALAPLISTDKHVILQALKELIHRGIMAVEDDMLVQPRMYHDSGYHLRPETLQSLQDIEDAEMADAPNGIAENEGTENGADNVDFSSTQKSADKSTQKSTHKEPITHTPARVSRGRGRDRDNNNLINSTEDSKETSKAKTEKPTQRKMIPVSSNPPSLEDVTAYFAERAAIDKALDYITPEEFYAMCETSGWTRGKNGQPIYNWKSYALQCSIYRKNHGSTAVNRPQGTSALKQGVQVTETKNDEYKHGW